MLLASDPGDILSGGSLKVGTARQMRFLGRLSVVVSVAFEEVEYIRS